MWGAARLECGDQRPCRGDLRRCRDRASEPTWPGLLGGRADRPFWIRIRLESVLGRLIAGRGSPGVGEVTLPRASAPDPDDTLLQVFNVLQGEARQIRSTPFGDVGTVFSGRGMELVWVSKHGEPVDDSWFRMKAVDLIMVLQGQLKLEFESPGLDDRVLGRARC